MKPVWLLVCLLLSLPAFAEEEVGREGGGGGGIRIGDKVYTLAEAGLKLEDPENPYFPDGETVEATVSAVQSIAEIFEGKDKKRLYNGIFSNDHVYQKVEVVDPALFSRLKDEYASFVDTLPIKGEFVLPAYTENKTTYLFPEFFEASPSTRALYLIHEAAFFIDPEEKLQNVLRLELAAMNYLRDSKNLKNKIAMYDSFAYLGYVDNNLSRGYYLKALVDEGIDLRLSDLLGPDAVLTPRCRVSNRPNSAYETDSVTLSQWGAREESFFRRFYRHKLRIESKIIDSMDFELGCGLVDKRASNFRLSLEKYQSDWMLTATAIDTALNNSDFEGLVTSARVGFWAPEPVQK